MGRVQRLLDKRIIRQVTPIFDTRALGYSSMLVAAKVDPENPHRAAQVINAHPGVSHNYLRNHEFNLWFTIATEPDSSSGSRARWRCSRARAGAESVRQLPTLKLFKIRMDLEMEGDTEALAAPAEASEPIELDPQPYDELDVAVIRALQGDMPVVPEPYAPAAARARHALQRLLEHLEGCRSAGCCAAWPRSSSTAAPASPPTAWACGRCPRSGCSIGRRMAALRGISHCYQRPTYEDWPYSVFTMAHGRSKEECDAILDAIADARPADRRARDALLVDRVQEDPPPVLHRGLQGLGARARVVSVLGITDATARPSCTRARCSVLPGRRQLAGARDARDRPRPDLHRRAARAPSSSTSTATATSTTSARGAR